MVKPAEGRTSVWFGHKARRRRQGGGQPSGLDRGRITGTTVRLLDAEGLERFSMRRLAAELSVTAMSVYWYVDTKDDLLELALDSAYGELPLPDPEGGEDWREQLRALARRYRALLLRHPWMSPLSGRYLNVGPNALAFSRTVQRVIRRSGLPAHGVTGAISAVFQFVYGYSTIEAHFLSRVEAAGMTPDEYHAEAMSAVTEAPEAAEVIEESRDILQARGDATVAEFLDHDFEFALDLLVAGIEAMVRRG
ncbi:TetR/AcrR family transcriptional regulator [Streptomyces sp. NPDC006458]|uniref:TetR/AcrR family transcriptional regulator n=1 Tax=Streptomyces sp. NPDC006458 TaxID=3154302 RepID=UPI0033AD486E